MRAQLRTYAYSLLHAHQVSAIIDAEPGTGAMVSRSSDGGLILPSLLARGIVPVRGSSRSKGKDKGGGAAFQTIVAHVRGGAPAFFAVDGPRGPRNRVGRGIAMLSLKTGAAVLNIVPVPSKRWIIRGSWDRLQIPKPFCTIDVYFGEPLHPHIDEDADSFRARIEIALNDLEREHDPLEATRSQFK